MEVRLNGRSAIVTGGSKGLGLAIAKEFAASGADVAILVRDAATLADAKGEIQKVQIDKQAVDPRDVPMLEDLVLAAVNSALKAAQEAAAAENPLSGMAAGLGGMVPGFPK